MVDHRSRIELTIFWEIATSPTALDELDIRYLLQLWYLLRYRCPRQAGGSHPGEGPCCVPGVEWRFGGREDGLIGEGGASEERATQTSEWASWANLGLWFWPCVDVEQGG